MTHDYTCLISYGISFIRIVALIFGGYFLIGIVVSKIREKFIHAHHNTLILELISHVVSYMILFGIALAIFHELGVNITAFLGIAGIVGVAIGYAAQSSISNVISGLFLMFERPFKIGDLLIINGIQGNLVDVTLFAITLKNASNILIRIPHEDYRKNAISNLSALPLRRYDFCIEVQNTYALQTLQVMISQVVDATQFRVSDKKSHIEVIKVYAYTTTFAIGIWTLQENMISLKSQILVELQQKFEQEGVVLSAFYLGHEKSLS